LAFVRVKSFDRSKESGQVYPARFDLDNVQPAGREGDNVQFADRTSPVGIENHKTL
jgi:hypothetical protein